MLLYFSFISLRTRTVRTNAEEVDRGGPSGHRADSGRALGAIHAVCRAWHALELLFRREGVDKTNSRVFFLRRYFRTWYQVLSSIFRKVGVFCSYVSYVRIKYRFGITAQLLGGASIGSHFQEEKAPKKKSAQEKKRTTPKEERIFGHFGSDSEESARSQRKSAPSHGKDLALWEAGEQALSLIHI